MAGHLDMLAQLCAPGGLGLPLGLLVAGLTGSVFHCAPMCGPFVLGQVSDRLAGIPAVRLCEMSRLRAGVLWPYHVGRLLTYAGLGAVTARPVPSLERELALIHRAGPLSPAASRFIEIATGR